MQKGGILTPPAYGTLGDASRNLFHGPPFQDVDFALEKMWHVKERYTAQLRIEVFNIFNHVNYAQVSTGQGSSPGALVADPSAGGGTGSTLHLNSHSVKPKRAILSGLLAGSCFLASRRYPSAPTVFLPTAMAKIRHTRSC